MCWEYLVVMQCWKCTCIPCTCILYYCTAHIHVHVTYHYYLPPCTAWCSSWWLLGNGWSIRICSDQGVLNRHCAMYIRIYMYIHSALSSIEILFCVCAVEGGGCSDGCDSGAHPQGAHSQWQSFKCTKGVQNISGSTYMYIVHVHVDCTCTCRLYMYM